MPIAKGTKRKSGTDLTPSNKKQKPATTSEKKQKGNAKSSCANLAKQAVTGPEAKVAVATLTQSLRDAAWKEALKDEFAKPYFASIAEFVASERSKGTVHPPAENVFEAFNVASLDDVKVVILGQDPYHEPGQAHGLCFSVPHGIKPPPSLKNMYKELVTDISGFKAPEHGNLMQWAKQGVLLLNATLTVREGHTEANSHSKCGWQQFTDAVIRVLNEHTENVVFLLWGGFAQKKGQIIDKSRHRVLESAHPSPLSFKKWQGCKAFSKCNEALRELGYTEVDWTLAPAPGSEKGKLESFFSKSQAV
jgi:uracil-DNA glycosylase